MSPPTYPLHQAAPFPHHGDLTPAISVKQAAERLSVSPRTVRNWIAAGVLRAYHVGPRLVRIDVSDVDALRRPVAG